jgi:nicotinate-nucleotide adenylyltransferase
LALAQIPGALIFGLKKTIGFFGGSFDPIHFGHINLALQLLEIHRLDEVLFCPAYCSPFKTETPPVSGEQRLEMLRLALQGIPRFRITSIEIEKKGPSYTIDTLRSLKGEGNFRLLLSEEAAGRFGQWKESAELLRLAPPLIGMRDPASFRTKNLKLKSGYTKTQIFDISSTEVRRRLKKGLYCGHLVPKPALDFIHAYKLYT